MPPIPTPYPVPAGPVDAEIVIKRSRFISWLRPVRSRVEVQEALADARRAYPDASHHCHAYLIGSPSSGEAGMSDDGEPSGTAGRPIFTVLGHKGVGDALVIVTRYFGGIKLGAGGLVRAYMAGAESVLSRMELIVAQSISSMTLSAAYADEQPIRYWCQAHGGVVDAVSYAAGVVVELTIPRLQIDALRSWCAARGIPIH